MYEANECGCKKTHQNPPSTASPKTSGPSGSCAKPVIKPSDSSSIDCSCAEPCPPRPELQVSELARSNHPYREIEATFNNSKCVVRLQKEPVPQEYEPPCDCSPSPSDASFRKAEKLENHHGGSPGHTINVYPEPELKRRGSKKAQNPAENQVAPELDEEANPNIFYFRIKRRCKDGEVKHNLDFELKAPRPWRRRDWYD